MNGRCVLLSAFIVSVMTAGAVRATPSQGANCAMCHTTVATGRFEVALYDATLDLGTQLDGNVRGALKTFVAAPGATRRLSVNVQNASGPAYLVISGFSGGGQDISQANHLQYRGDPAWTSRGAGSYFTKSVISTGIDGFDLTVNVGTPDDVYDLTFAMAGSDNSGAWCQQVHFYIQVVSVPAVESLVVVSPNGGEELSAGDIYTIAWQGGANDDLIEIEYSTDDGSTWTQIGTGLANAGGYDWLVPAISTTQALVRVSSAGDSDASDAPFTILWTPPSPTISGVVATSGAEPIAGVSVSANNGGGSAVTDASGAYSLTVPYDWSGVVTPSKTDYTFAPTSRSYSNVIANQADQDYIGTAASLPDLTISGIVTAGDTTPIAGVSVSANNGGGSAVTDASGAYSLTVPYDWSGVVTPSKTDYTFAPTSRSYSSVTGNLANEDYVGTATPSGDITIDNGDPGTSSVGQWTGVTGGDAYEQDASHSRRANAMYVYWMPLTGSYEVSMWWMSEQDPLEPSQQSGSEDQKTPQGQMNKRGGLGVSLVVIFDGDEVLDEVFVDQSLDGGQWNAIGTYDFNTEARVAIVSTSNRRPSCADAVRFAPSDAPADDAGDDDPSDDDAGGTGGSDEEEDD